MTYPEFTKPFLRVIKHLAAHPGSTGFELGVELDLSRATLWHHMKRACALELGHPYRVRVSGWTRQSDRGPFVPKFEVHPHKADAEKPRGKSHAKVCREYRAKRKAAMGVTRRGASYKLAQGGNRGIWGPLTQLSKVQP